MRYSEYEWRAAEDGTLYLTPTKTAQPSIYDPLAEYQKIVLDAINIGRMGMSLSLIHICFDRFLRQLFLFLKYAFVQFFPRAGRCDFGVDLILMRQIL